MRTLTIPDKPKSFPEDIYQSIKDLITVFNGKFSLGTGENQTSSGNIIGKYLEVNTPDTPDTDFIVYHNLGYIPKNYLLIRSAKPRVLYTSPTVAADTKTLTLRASVVGWSGAGTSTVITIWVF